jgi:hypothetical protein
LVADKPHSQHAKAQWKRLPVRISDARCPPTIPTRQDSRFIGRAHTKLVHAKKGNRLLLTLRTLNLRRWDDRAVTPCRPRKNRRTGGSLPAAFCENFEQCGISTIIAARREDRVPPRVRCPTHAPVRDTRTNRVRNTFWRAFRAISVFHQQVRRPQALATRIGRTWIPSPL